MGIPRYIRYSELAVGGCQTGGTSGAREVLSSVASSIISVAATAFSITIVALQLAASNYSPRLLRNFMQDTGNQVVLGTFIGTFVYCLLVLRTIRGDGDDYNQFVPQVSVTVALLLALASISVLIYFIHHAATIIQVSHIIMEVGMVESREAITPRPSLLDLDVKLSPHPAPDVLKLSLLLMW